MDDITVELERSLRQLCESIGGAGCVEAIGYSSQMGEQYTQHAFYVVVRRRVVGALIGKNGANAQRIRELLKTRAVVLGNQEPVDVRLLRSMDQAPPGVFDTPESREVVRPEVVRRSRGVVCEQCGKRGPAGPTADGTLICSKCAPASTGLYW